MRLSELIKDLERLKFEHGDVEVCVRTLTHQWAPEPEIRGTDKDKYVLLNP